MTSTFAPQKLDWRPLRVAAPADDGAILAAPPLADAPAAAEQAQARLGASSLDLQGRSLPRLRQWARGECLSAALRYTREVCGIDEDEVSADGLLFVAGHQPELFHPGVWVKNFAIDGLAAATGGVSLSLVVDNDALRHTGIRVPAGGREKPRYETVLFDEPRTSRPWEEAVVRDRELFASFRDRIVERMRDWRIEPVLSEMWPAAVAGLDRGGRLADCLTAARHTLERRWGAANLELPVSRMCETEPFLWFAGHLLAQLPRFHRLHNRILDEYRVLHRVRSRTHPVPELSERDGWLEAPFWVWHAGDEARRPVFARQSGREVQISDGREEFAVLPLDPEMDACCAVEVLRRLPERGVRFRTRALTTTLFSRVCLGDLFVHGIGGAKYDEMTDRIIAEFFGIEPPRFLTLSATLHLPLCEPFAVSEDDARRLREQLRDLRYNADRHGLPPEAAPLVERKQALVAEQQAAQVEGMPAPQRRARRAENRRRYRELQQVNRQLAEAAAPRRESLEAELHAVESMLAANRVLRDRTFAFCLHPASRLRDLMASLHLGEVSPPI